MMQSTHTQVELDCVHKFQGSRCPSMKELPLVLNLLMTMISCAALLDNLFTLIPGAS